MQKHAILALYQLWHKDMFGVRLHLDLLYEIARDTARNSEGRKKKALFLAFSLKDDAMHQDVVECRTCLYAKSRYRAMNEVFVTIVVRTGNAEQSEYAPAPQLDQLMIWRPY